MHKDKHIRVRGHRRDQVDVRKLSRAVIALAAAQAEKEAAEHATPAKAATARNVKAPEAGLI